MSDEKRLPRRLAAILYADVAGYSRLTGEDEDATHRTLAAHLDVVNAAVAGHGGRVVHTAGDAVLARFDAVVDALTAAVAVQAELGARNAALPAGRRVAFRIGVNLGDVIEDRGDIYGDGVNVAARLESLAEPGGICVAGSVHDAIGARLELDYAFLGEQRVKNIARPVRAYRVVAAGEPAAEAADAGAAALAAQEVHFHTTADGVVLAYARIGDGPVLVKAGNWMNHLEYEAGHPPWQWWWRELAREFSLVRYDQRGNGLSDRDVAELDFERLVDDLDSLTAALGLERFALLGISQGCAVSAAYAARRPERVSHLVLYGGYVRGWRRRGSAEEVKRGEAFTTLIEQGWGQDNPAFRQLFTTMFLPDGTPEDVDAFNELQRISVSPQTAARLHEALGEVDVSDALPRIAAPTLVLHVRDDARAPFEQGRAFAAGIPGARLVALPGRNHLLLPTDASWPRLFAEIRDFVRGP